MTGGNDELFMSTESIMVMVVVLCVVVSELLVCLNRLPSTTWWSKRGVTLTGASSSVAKKLEDKIVDFKTVCEMTSFLYCLKIQYLHFHIVSDFTSNLLINQFEL